MSFHEVLFPVDIALNSEGGPTRKTDIVALVSGHEERNAPWAGSRRAFNAGYGVKSVADIEDVIAFFEARHGRLYGFRFRDPFDFKSCRVAQTPAPDDQLIGTGDGVETSFQLVKRYASGAASYARPIQKPVAGSVRVAVDGVEQAQGADFTLDETTGGVTLASAPGAGLSVTAGFLFDTPVRFDTDELRINLAAFQAGDIPSIPLLEILI
ncbi:phage distal tail protein, Rcc01695 family [Hyphococcus sp.]|uniref:phage distal tail protein, Rcc01695 family n=1 Tax=Hyphococcus sp. TaxID=2038636 RepID=UPI003CCB89EA